MNLILALLTIIYVIWNTHIRTLAFGSIQSNFFTQSQFMEGIFVHGTNARSLNQCLMRCHDHCTAVRYFRSNETCHMFADVLLLQGNMTEMDDTIPQYVKVCFTLNIVLLKSVN